MTAAAHSQAQFVSLVSSWLVTLPYDLKILFDLKDDENIPREVRALATSALIYIVSPRDAIADRDGNFANYFDDCLVLRMALCEIKSANDEDTQSFIERFPEYFGDIETELKVCRSVMGELYDWLESKRKASREQIYKGKTIEQYLDDEEAGEFLYEDGLEFRTEYDVEEEELADKLKKADTVLDVMRRRHAVENPV